MDWKPDTLGIGRVKEMGARDGHSTLALAAVSTLALGQVDWESPGHSSPREPLKMQTKEALRRKSKDDPQITGERTVVVRRQGARYELTYPPQ